MSCAEARLQLSLLLDGELEHAQIAALEDHLAGCAACRAFERVLRAEQADVIKFWSAVSAPHGFAERVAAGLPPRARPAAARLPAPLRLRTSRRLQSVAAALLVVLVGGSVLAQPEAWANFGVFLRHVVLRETASPAPQRTLSTGRLTLDEAQHLVSWRIRLPSDLPDGYGLVAVEADELHAFAVGPTIVLHYQPAGGDTARELALVELQTASEVSEPVAPGAAHQVPVGSAGRTGLLIDGSWVDHDGQQTWESSTLLRLIVEYDDVVVQLQVDPRAGWDADQLARIAASLG